MFHIVGFRCWHTLPWHRMMDTLWQRSRDVLGFWHYSEFTKKCHQCGFLLLRASILRVFAVGGQATDIADAYGMGVVPLAVRSHLCERSAMMHRAVAVDDEVISD